MSPQQEEWEDEKEEPPSKEDEADATMGGQGGANPGGMDMEIDTEAQDGKEAEAEETEAAKTKKKQKRHERRGQKKRRLYGTDNKDLPKRPRQTAATEAQETHADPAAANSGQGAAEGGGKATG